MLKIALVQQKAGPDIRRNIDRGIAAVRDAAAKGAGLIAFPELSFTRFFPQNRLAGDRFEYAEPIPGPMTDLFCDLAAELGVVLVFNLFEKAGDRAFDSSPVIDADGSLLGVTRMMHITQYEGFWEQDYYDPGDSGAPVYESAVGRIGVAICYDRHYPEYLRALALQDAQLVVVPQAGAIGEWPDGVYQAELQAGSFQNGFFMALANRVGQEERLRFAGESLVTDASGRIIARAAQGQECILYADVDLGSVADAPANSLFKVHRRPEEYYTGTVRVERGEETSPLPGTCQRVRLATGTKNAEKSKN